MVSQPVRRGKISSEPGRTVLEEPRAARQNFCKVRGAGLDPRADSRIPAGAVGAPSSPHTGPVVGAKTIQSRLQNSEIVSGSAWKGSPSSFRVRERGHLPQRDCAHPGGAGAWPGCPTRRRGREQSRRGSHRAAAPGGSPAEPRCEIQEEFLPGKGGQALEQTLGRGLESRSWRCPRNPWAGAKAGMGHGWDSMSWEGFSIPGMIAGFSQSLQSRSISKHRWGLLGKTSNHGSTGVRMGTPVPGGAGAGPGPG